MGQPNAQRTKNADWDRVLLVVAIVAGFCVIIGTLMIQAPTLFPDVSLFPGSELVGVVVYDLALATLAAYVFHLLVVALPRRQQRRHNDAVVGPEVDEILRAGAVVVHAVRHAADAHDDLSLPPPQPLVSQVMSQARADAPFPAQPNSLGAGLAWNEALHVVIEDPQPERVALRVLGQALEGPVLEAAVEERRRAERLLLALQATPADAPSLAGLTDDLNGWFAALDVLHEYRREIDPVAVDALWEWHSNNKQS